MVARSRVGTTIIALIATTVAFAIAMTHASYAWAAGTATGAAAQTNEHSLLASSSYYLELNDNAPDLKAADITASNCAIDSSVSQLDSWPVFKYNGTSKDSSIRARYRSVGWLRNQSDHGLDTELVDIVVTFTPLATLDNEPYHESWGGYPGYALSKQWINGFYTAQLPRYKMTIEFYQGNSKLNLNGSIWTLGQSLDEGEGFAVESATAGYISDDAPETNPDSSKTKVAELLSDSKWHTLEGSYLYEIGTLGSGWYGFIGGPCVYTTGTESWYKARNDPYEADPKIERANDDHPTVILSNGKGAAFYGRYHGWNYIDKHTNGNSARSSLGSWKIINGNLISNSFHWRSAAAEAKMTAGTVTLMQFAISTPNGTPASGVVHDMAGITSAGMSADNVLASNWGYRGTRSDGLLVTDQLPTGTYGFKWFTQLFAPSFAIQTPNPIKAVDKEEAKVGDVVTYTITQQVNKHGSDCAEGYTYSALTFDDTLPEGLQYQSLSITDPSGNEVSSSAGTVQVTNSSRTVSYAFDQDYLVNDLDYNGGSFTFTIKALVLDSAAGTTLVNKGLFTFNDNVKKETNEVETVVPSPETAIPVPAKEVDKAIAPVGETVTYTITEDIADRGSNSTFQYSSLTFTDELPQGLTYKSLKVEMNTGEEGSENTADITTLQGTTANDGQTVTYSFKPAFLESLAYDGNESLVFTITATVNEGAEGSTLLNDAVVAVDDADLTTNEVETLVPKNPVIPSPTKAVDRTYAWPGDVVTYTITEDIADLAGTTSSHYESLKFSDTLPDGLTYTALTVTDEEGADITSTAGTAAVVGKTVGYAFKTETLDALAYDGTKSYTFTITASVDAGTEGSLFENVATVTIDDNPLSTNKVTTVVPNKPVKGVDKTTASPGDSLVYTITIPMAACDWSNLGGLRFVDELPNGLSFKSLELHVNHAQFENGNLADSLGTLSTSGRKVAYTFDQKSFERFPNGEPFELVFTINASISKGDPSEYGNTLINDADAIFDNRYSMTTNEVETRVDEPLVPLPLTGSRGDTLIIAAALIAILGGTVGFYVRQHNHASLDSERV